MLAALPFIVFLIGEYSFRGAALILSAISLQFCAGAMVLHPIRWHITKPYSRFGEITSDGKLHSLQESKIFSSFQRMKDTILDNWRLLKSPRACILGGLVCFNMGIFLNVWTLIPFVMLYEGYTLEEVALCLAVSGVCNLISRVLLAALGACFKLRSPTFHLIGSCIAVGTLAGTYLYFYESKSLPVFLYISRITQKRIVVCSPIHILTSLAYSKLLILGRKYDER